MSHSLIITCEHAGNEIPEPFKHLFVDADEVLNSHRGWDPGALKLAQALADATGAPLFYQTISRLLIEMNRSLDSVELFSTYTSPLPDSVKKELANVYYRPYRSGVQKAIAELRPLIVHFSVHTFTPVWNSGTRNVDIGILFDPERGEEHELADYLLKQFSDSLPQLKIVFNEPYKGTDDGLTTYLRSQYHHSQYCGIELEVSQKFIGSPLFQSIEQALVEAATNLMSG